MSARYRQRWSLLLLIAAITLPVAFETSAAGRIVHKERSLYRTILVAQDGDRMCMQFSVKRDQRNQSCRNTRNPRELVFEYAKLAFSAFLLNPDPESILIVGLGGGTLPETWRELLPAARIDVVEIDPAVVKVARSHFAYEVSPPGELYVQDARIFGKRAARRGDGYDLIVLDAFNGDYIPEHLMTREYLLETRALLNPGGVVMANTFSISRLYHHENATYASVFGRLLTVASPMSANRLILAMNGPLPADATIDQHLARWRDRVVPYGVDLDEVRASINDRPDWDLNARVLTDQYSPANLLQQ